MPTNSPDPSPNDAARPGNPPHAGCPHLTEQPRNDHQSTPAADSPADDAQSDGQSDPQSAGPAAPVAPLPVVPAGPVAIPVALAHLPTVSGMAVPWITPRLRDGRFVLGVIDADRQRHALLQRLCGVCGRAHEDRMVALARPQDLARQMVAEPPLHPVCAHYTARVCPVVGGRRQHYRATPRPGFEPSAVAGGMAYYVQDEAQAAARRGAPTEPWFAVWLATYDAVWDPLSRLWAASWRDNPPRRIRPVSAPATAEPSSG